jgi:superfamily II DNA or RNA helicase
MIAPPEPSQIVSLRNRSYVVQDVKACESGSPATATLSQAAPWHHVTLSSVEDDGHGEELEVVWELEAGASVKERSTLPNPTSFDIPAKLDAFLDAVRWGTISQADDKALQAPFRSGIEIEEYQLDPVARALSMPRVNLLIADDVGLGKTIETGLVAQELTLRHRVRSILVVCPSSIQRQWQEEMRDKFGMEFRIVDAELLKDLRRKRGIHANPWKHFPRLITSIDFLKRERPMRLFRETLPAAGEPTYPRKYDLLIVDEAHNVAPSGRSHYAVDSQRTQAIRTLAPHFEHKLFLSATPHNGYRESFTALLELLDNQRFARNIEPNRQQLQAVMVRRLKSELEKRWDGSSRFAPREVRPLEVAYTQGERDAHQLLKRYTTLCLKSAGDMPGGRMAAEFVLKLLKKRLFSSPAAFVTTLEKHAASRRTAAPAKISTSGLLRQIELLDEDFDDDTAQETATEETVETASRSFGSLPSDQGELLRDLRTWAGRAAETPDSKAKALVAWLEQTLKTGGKWSRERVIIFTEYRATQKWLHDLLAAHGFAGNNRLLQIYGGMPLEDREQVKAAFQAHPDDAPVRILLATDAASEGLNLQNYCHRLIHFEVPWNPNRMEQRNGRVDRHGQKATQVDIFHFVGAGFDSKRNQSAHHPGDLEGDLEFLMRAAIKVNTIREDLGKVGPVIAKQVEEAMLGARQNLDTAKAETQAEPARRMLKFERQLQDQLKKLHDQLDTTSRELHLDPDTVTNIVRVGLELGQQPQLREVRVESAARHLPAIIAWHLPPMSGSWAACAAGLEHPHTKAIRPIVFDASAARGRDDVVLAHLNHPLVQRCQRLLRAEVWTSGTASKLQRCTARMVADNVLSTPAVIAYGRLVVLGADGHRLHEELITAGGTIKEGRFSRMNVGEVKDALAAATPNAAPGFIEESLLKLWPKVTEPLLKSLEVRRDEKTKNLQTFLDERADKEAAHLDAVLTELEKSIRAELEAEAPQQLELFDQFEKQQRESDLHSLRLRLQQLPAEREREVAHLRARYRNPQARLFPVAITFLVPKKAIAELSH